ncbi:MAG: hypothetical protein A2079_03605 [Geobacteraceae bacterium GWC2_48_7]|nr:MAG: hypothetical protein A2079_03605 [Geobacteraceae bacterium GWC2_48_7]
MIKAAVTNAAVAGFVFALYSSGKIKVAKTKPDKADYCASFAAIVATCFPWLRPFYRYGHAMNKKVQEPSFLLQD